MLVTDSLTAYRRGSTEPWTAKLVAALAAARDARYILETGTFEAKTTLELAATCPDAFITSVESNFDRFEAALRVTQHLPNVTLVHADAIHYLTQTDTVWDFVFLDDDHTASHVGTEIDALYRFASEQPKKVSPGGLICVHDVCGPFGLDAVVLARHGFVLDLPKLHVAGGLGIIQVP